MGKINIKSIFLILIAVIISTTPVTASATDVLFYSSNDIRYYNPDDTCGPNEDQDTPKGNGSVGTYKNPVYKENAADPSVINGTDGNFYTYATGGTLLESEDMSNWKVIANDWKLKGAPSEAGGQKWAPDVVKINNSYVLTYTIPTGTPEIGGDQPPQIAYAIGDSPGGVFTYAGKLSLDHEYSIDSHIFVDDDGKIWLFWGGGSINTVQLTFDGKKLKTKGPQKQLLAKGVMGSNGSTIEGAWVTKRNGWYYLTFSQGKYDIKDGGDPYRVLVARSKTVNGNYKPESSMRSILEGKAPIVYPGHHSIVTDSSGNDWIVYHGYFKSEQNKRSLNVDPITYSSGWPVVNSGNGPSNSKQDGSANRTGNTPAERASNSTSTECCEENTPVSTNIPLSGNDNREKTWNYLIGELKLTDIQAAGVMGNIEQESGFNPNAKNPTSGAYGIVQWLGGRKTDLEKFANERNTSIDDLGMQLDFLKKELQGDYYGERVYTPLRAAKTIEEATNIWLRHFEIPCLNEACFVEELAIRKPYSERMFEQYAGTLVSSTSTGCGETNPGQNSEFSVDGMTIYNQEDPRWSSEVFGYTTSGEEATIHSSGCGPTSMATIITALTKKTVTPSQTTKYAKQKDMYVSGVGASWTLGPTLAQKWGLKSKTLSNNVKVINKELRKGGMVITSGTGAAPFTSAGHFITIRGVTSDGKWKIADSNGSKGQENSKKEWDPVHILSIANSGNLVLIYK